jgi:opacity protein-like surface antigen
MKKLVIIAALFLAASTAMAGNFYAAGEYETAEDRSTKADSYTTGVIVGYKDGGWQYSGKVSSGQAEWGNGSITNRYEGRVKHTWSAMGLKPYLGVRLGESVKSASNFSYYAVDAGVAVPVTAKVEVDFSYRYRNAFDTANKFQTDRYGIEGKLKLTDKDSLGLRYAQSYGDSLSNSLRLQYTRSF